MLTICMENDEQQQYPPGALARASFFLGNVKRAWV
jgi:hypothetical protein